jgi:hypothetical protein
MELRTELPDEIVGWVADAARRFNVSPSAIVHRALEHYLRHMAECRDASEKIRRHRPPRADATNANSGTKKTDCPFPQCPFGDACPSEVCSL